MFFPLSTILKWPNNLYWTKILCLPSNTMKCFYPLHNWTQSHITFTTNLSFKMNNKIPPHKLNRLFVYFEFFCLTLFKHRLVITTHYKDKFVHTYTSIIEQHTLQTQSFPTLFNVNNCPNPDFETLNHIRLIIMSWFNTIYG
jgi:hypothetical protein